MNFNGSYTLWLIFYVHAHQMLVLVCYSFSCEMGSYEWWWCTRICFLAISYWYIITGISFLIIWWEFLTLIFSRRIVCFQLKDFYFPLLLKKFQINQFKGIWKILTLWKKFNKSNYVGKNLLSWIKCIVKV